MSTVKLQPRRYTPIGLTPSNTTNTAFGGHTISHYGICELTLSHHGHNKSYAFHVVNTVGPTILGLPTCRDMKLVTLNHGISTTQAETASMPNPQDNVNARSELLCQYQDCFQGIGCFQVEFHITLDPTVPPVIHPPRLVPEALREPLKKELDALVEQGIIAKVDEPTDWAGELISLCNQGQWYASAVLRPKRPQSCHQTPTSLHPNIR